MTDQPGTAVPSTSAAASAVAQTRVAGAAAEGSAGDSGAVRDAGFVIGAGVERGTQGLPYERKPDDPIYRPLWIYTIDPAASRLEGAQAVINVPYEPLAPGPAGALFRVEADDPTAGVRYRQLDPEKPTVLISSGRRPSPGDPQFHQQMVYAVCSSVYAAFRSAMGRHIAWGFDRPEPDPAAGEGATRTRLVLYPHGGDAQNAWYDPSRGSISFGYYEAGDTVSGRNVPRGVVFTCLSHDIVAHEVTHALLDGLRTYFNVPTGRDVLGFHEGFADLVAILQHFSYPEVVRSAVASSRGVLSQAALLTDLARQFGHTTPPHDAGATATALRTAIDVGDDGQVRPREYKHGIKGAHALGAVLVSAVFDAYLTVFRRKTVRFIRLATEGRGVLPAGEIPADLKDVLADRASKLASQFLAICIRAIDYCPPVDLEYGEYLRAMITADHELVADDKWGYREALIDAFARHKIYPPNVRSLSEDELRWKPPERAIEPVHELAFAKLQFRGDPARAAGADELRRQARELGALVVRHPDQFGVAARGDPELDGDEVELPVVQSIRAARRVGPDGQVLFDLVAEVTQRRIARDGGFESYGGATAIIGPDGAVRYVIAKNVRNRGRLARQRDFVRGAGARYWTKGAAGWLVPRRDFFWRLHDDRAPGDRAGASD